MLNPVLSNFRIVIGDDFFPDFITEKYTKYLYDLNYPLKTVESYIHETIQNLTIPGLNLQTLAIDGLPNNKIFSPDSPDFTHTTHREIYEGNNSLSDVIDGNECTITFKNTILNWMYLFELCYTHYKRKRQTKVGTIYLIMHDSADVPNIMFNMSRAFISNMPGLEFAYNESFSESKTFDVTWTFNQLDVKFLIPQLKQETFRL